MDVATILLTYGLAGGFGAWAVGQIVKSEINPLVALAVTGIGGLCALIPTIGRVIAFVVMTICFRQFARGDWQDSVFATLGANAMVLVVLLLIRTSAN